MRRILATVPSKGIFPLQIYKDITKLDFIGNMFLYQVLEFLSTYVCFFAVFATVGTVGFAAPACRAYILHGRRGWTDTLGLGACAVKS